MAAYAFGEQYLLLVGPCYGFFGLGMALYFASQGTGNMVWPFTAGVVRLAVAAGRWPCWRSRGSGAAFLETPQLEPLQ